MKHMTPDELQKKVQEFRGKGVDLSTEEDLSIAVMNLISLEEHFFFSGVKTGKGEYYDMLHQVREMRKELLARMIPKTEAESWCISKHLLATTMRLMEVGTKLQHEGKKDEAKSIFAHAYSCYNLFFALRLKIVEVPEAIAVAEANKPMNFDDIMKGMVNCCKE